MLAPLTLLLLVCLVPSPSSACADDWPKVSIPSRAQELDGLNGLYLFLRLHGSQVGRPQVEKHLPPRSSATSLEDLRVAAAVLGLPAVIYRCTPEKLATLPLPALVYIESDTSEGGGFSLLLSVDDQQDTVTLLMAGTVVFARMTTDEFARSWSGFLMLPRARRSPTLFGPIGLAVGPLALLVGVFVWYHSRARIKRLPVAAGGCGAS